MTIKAIEWPNKRGRKTPSANSEKIGKRHNKIVVLYGQIWETNADNNDKKKLLFIKKES